MKARTVNNLADRALERGFDLEGRISAELGNTISPITV
jgi:hypothetical protein